MSYEPSDELAVVGELDSMVGEKKLALEETPNVKWAPEERQEHEARKAEVKNRGAHLGLITTLRHRP